MTDTSYTTSSPANLMPLLLSSEVVAVALTALTQQMKPKQVRQTIKCLERAITRRQAWLFGDDSPNVVRLFTSPNGRLFSERDAIEAKQLTAIAADLRLRIDMGYCK